MTTTGAIVTKIANLRHRRCMERKKVMLDADYNAALGLYNRMVENPHLFTEIEADTQDEAVEVAINSFREHYDEYHRLYLTDTAKDTK